MAYLIKPDGTIVENVDTSFKSLKELVGENTHIIKSKTPGEIIIRCHPPISKEKNLQATSMYSFGSFDSIFGNVVICNESELK